MGLQSCQNAVMHRLLISSAIIVAGTGLLAACGGDDTSIGELIAFSSDQDGDWDVFVLDPATGVSRKVIDNGAADLNPNVSPDGQQIVFSSNYLDGEIDDYQIQTQDGWVRITEEKLGSPKIYIVDTQGENLRRLTENSAIDEQPAWSPDGLKIAFQSDMSGDIEIHVMEADGDNVEQLTTSPGDDWSPTWSPDGSRIAFASSRNGNWDIFTMNADGSEVQQVTDNEGMDWLPAWSPDGDKIAFASNRDGNWEIYVVGTDGGDAVNLSNHPGRDLEPVWSPDGDRLLFQSEQAGSQELYLMNADGSSPERLEQSGLPFSWTRP